MTTYGHPRILILCTVQTGVDAVAEIIRRGFPIVGIVGLHPDNADPMAVSGFIDVAPLAKRWGVPHYHVRNYNLKSAEEKVLFEEIPFDLIWVAGWQRLVPEWLINSSRLGVLGGHGSPDGICGGRGRSPQNWALMLGCQRFDLALFRITSGVDEGPILAQRSFFYSEQDDIAVSYYRTSLAMADMVCEILNHPDKLLTGTSQPTEAFYYPQRKPEDGWVDWSLSKEQITRHCRALTRPYPGLRTRSDSAEIKIWRCQLFDDVIEGEFGAISTCFESGDFLVNCLNGRVLIREWESTSDGWRPSTGCRLEGRPFTSQLKTILQRHSEKYSNQPISPRILRWLD